MESPILEFDKPEFACFCMAVPQNGFGVGPFNPQIMRR